MRRYEEMERSDSCFNRAHENEWVFVLLGRDAAAPATIRYWCAQRVSLGKNQVDDPQITEALRCAEAMEKDHYQREMEKIGEADGDRR